MHPHIQQRFLESADKVAEEALQLLLGAAAAAIQTRGRFVLSLAGGSTPKRLYQLLSQQEQDWKNWYLVYGDERCLPAYDPERNSFMVEECWLDKVNFPKANHLVPDFSEGVDKAAIKYAADIEKFMPIDFALLGMGEDGHTASLFPGDQHDHSPVVAIHDSPKPPPERISLSMETLSQSHTVCFLVTGSGKREAMALWKQAADIPVSHIIGVFETYLLMDEAANPAGVF